MERMKKRFVKIGLFFIFSIFHISLFAESATITFVKGKVEVQNGSSWSAVTVGQELPEASVVSTGFNSEVRFQYNGTVMALGPLTRVTLEKMANTETKEIVNVFLNTGAVRTKVTHPTNKRVSQTVRNPISVASVRGTDYMFFDSGRVSCFEGAVATFPAYYLKNTFFVENSSEDDTEVETESEPSDYESATATATTEAQDIADFAPPSSVVVAAGQFVTVLSNGQIAKPSSSVMNQRDKVTNSVVVLSRSEGVSMGQGSTDKSSKQNKQQESAGDNPEVPDVPETPEEVPEVPDVPETPDVPDDTKPVEPPKTGSVDVNVSFE